MTCTILILPGLNNSGTGHWQTIWEDTLPGALRVQQRDWDAPRREDWVAELDKAICQAPGQVVLAAHSLGCATAVWWGSSTEGSHTPARCAAPCWLRHPMWNAATFRTS